MNLQKRFCSAQMHSESSGQMTKKTRKAGHARLAVIILESSENSEAAFRHFLKRLQILKYRKSVLCTDLFLILTLKLTLTITTHGHHTKQKQKAFLLHILRYTETQNRRQKNLRNSLKQKAVLKLPLPILHVKILMNV